MIKEYVANTHGHTHTLFTLQVMCVFKIKRAGERHRYAPFERLHNRQLLWHGSRLTNYVGLLSQGLRITPPEAPVVRVRAFNHCMRLSGRLATCSEKASILLTW
jgi:poly [ADP-ribose] polymerase